MRSDAEKVARGGAMVVLGEVGGLMAGWSRGAGESAGQRVINGSIIHRAPINRGSINRGLLIGRILIGLYNRPLLICVVGVRASHMSAVYIL